MLIDVGQVVANKYELVRLLGRGSMGEVWSAHHQTLREQVALKVLSWPPSRTKSPRSPPPRWLDFASRRSGSPRGCPRKTRHIARVTDYGEDDGLPYLVMELLDGEVLDAALRQRGLVGLPEAVQIVSQIARALDQAHAEAVAHRDLKPANVFLSRDEEGRLLVKLLDFGIARTIHAHRVPGPFSTEKGFVFGTPGYMSPEQARASPKLDHRCDLWALATIAYQMLTGHLPVEGGDIPTRSHEEPLRRPHRPVAPARAFPPRGPGRLLRSGLRRSPRRSLRGRVAAGAARSRPLASRGRRWCRLPRLRASPDTTGSTGTEFSATVAHEAMQVHRRSRTRIALVLGAVLVAAVALSGVLRALASPRAVASRRGQWPPPGVGRRIAAQAHPGRGDRGSRGQRLASRRGFTGRAAGGLGTSRAGGAGRGRTHRREAIAADPGSARALVASKAHATTTSSRA